MKIAYLGNEYSHTFAACKALCGDAEFVGKKTAHDVATAVASGECDMCVLPIENSVEGSVTATADALLELPLFIRAETALSIHHNLVAIKGASLKDIRTVFSHPQALAQCRGWLKSKLKDADTVAVHSTSYALELLSSADKAAVAATAASGQEVLVANVEDYSSNATRFLLLGREEGTVGDRGSVIFSAGNRPGGLLSVLKVFEVCGINMTYIQSRPSKSGLGEYIFFVDFILPLDKETASLGRLLTLLEEWTSYCKFLGRYYNVNKSEAT